VEADADPFFCDIYEKNGYGIVMQRQLACRGGYGPWATWVVARVVAQKCSRDFSPNKIKP
jgi:hypothetical protein